MNSQQQQALALAAVFEAATLADQIATSGDCDHAAMEALLDGVMTMEATDFDTIYPRPALFRNGLRLLRQSLNREQTRQAARSVHRAPLARHSRTDSSAFSFVRPTTSCCADSKVL